MDKTFKIFEVVITIAAIFGCLSFPIIWVEMWVHPQGFVEKVVCIKE